MIGDVYMQVHGENLETRRTTCPSNLCIPQSEDLCVPAAGFYSGRSRLAWHKGMDQGTVQPMGGDQLVNPGVQELVLPKHLLAKGDQFVKLILKIFITFSVCQGGLH